MACHGEIAPVGHANGNAGCPPTQLFMNMQVASTDPGRRTLILSHCVVGQTAGKQGPPFSARRRRRTEKGPPTNTSHSGCPAGRVAHAVDRSRQTIRRSTSCFMARTYENAFENYPWPNVYYGRNFAFRSAKATSFAERKATLLFENSDISKHPRPSPPGADGPGSAREEG